MVGNLARAERYLTKPVDVDNIGSGLYAALGRHMDSRYLSGTRLELGTATSRGFNPKLQVRFPTGRRDSHAGSYLDSDDFSGCAYTLTDDEFEDIRSLMESD